MPTRDELYTALRNADKAGDAVGARRLAAYIQSLPAETAVAPKAPKDAPGMLASAAAGVGKGIGDVVLGAQSLVGKGLRGVGATTAGDWLVNDADAGRAKLAAELAPYKDANPLTAGAGEIGANVLTTLPVGGGLAAGVRAVAPALVRAGASAPVLQRLASSVASSGFTTGAPAATTLGGRAANLGLRAAGGAATGGASAALINNDDAVTGALVGAALPPALAGVGKGAKYGGNALRSLIQPLTEDGQQMIAAGIINKFGKGGPMMVNAAELVPGSMPTLTEATNNAGIAGLQRTVRSMSGESTNRFVDRERANVAARLAAFDNIAGDKAAIKLATQERDQIADALYGQAFTADNMRRALAAESQQTRAPFSGVGLSGAPEDLATPGLRALMARPGFRSAAEDAKRLAANYGVQLNDPLQSLEGLHYIKLALDDALNPGAATALGRNASSAVMDMRNRLAEELGQVSPLYQSGRKVYADMSKPIDAMEALQGLTLTDGAGNMTLTKTQNGLRTLERLRAAPGVDPAKAITPEQMSVVASLRDDLLRQNSLGAGKAAGSDTLQNITTNNILANLLPGRLGVLAQQKIGTPAAQVGQLLYSKSNEAIKNQLVDLLLDPALAAPALARQQAITGPSALERLLQSQSVGQPILRIAPVATADR